MHQLTIGMLFAVSLGVSLLWGIGWAYVGVFIPALILLNQLPIVNLPHLPVAAEFAPLYGMLVALPFRGDSVRLRLCSVDVVMVLLLASATVTALTTEVFETGVNTFRNDLLRLTLPYFFARIVFKDWHMRRAALGVLVAILAVVSVAALIEFRLYPYFYDHLLQMAGMQNPIHAMAYGRYGFTRVSGPVEHPIFFGNMCVCILAMVAVLARTSGLRLTNGWVATALFAAFGCVIVSISFTPYTAMVAGTFALLALTRVPFTRKLLFPLTLIGFVAGFLYTAHVATQPLGEKGSTDFEGSLYTRRMIIHQSWGIAATAGPFGHGLRADFSNEADFDLVSVDNSYMQFTMTRGWVYTVLWICIGLTFAWRMGRAFAAVTNPEQVFPLAVCTAAGLGLMVSMYTVWAGALYTVVWMVLLGLGNTLADAVFDARAAAANRPASYGLRPPTVRLPAGMAGA